jgi:hypothetical protein
MRNAYAAVVEERLGCRSENGTDEHEGRGSSVSVLENRRSGR